MHLSKAIKTVAYIDGDVLACQAAAVNAGYEDEGSLDTLHILVRQRLQDWVNFACADDYRVVISEGKSFRYSVYPEYKANRRGKDKPQGTEEALSYLRKEFSPISRSGYEADDVISILCQEKDTGEQRIAVSIDKDFGQIEGWWFNPLKMRCPRYNSYDDTVWVLAEQWACGDPSDGYPGIPKFGPAAFKKLAATHTPLSILAGVKAEYLSRGLGTSYMNQMYQCAKILDTWEEIVEVEAVDV